MTLKDKIVSGQLVEEHEDLLDLLYGWGDKKEMAEQGIEFVGKFLDIDEFPFGYGCVGRNSVVRLIEEDKYYACYWYETIQKHGEDNYGDASFVEVKPLEKTIKTWEMV